MRELPDDPLPPEVLLAEGEAVLREYRRELAQQLNESIDAITANFDEALPIASTVRQSMRGLRRLAHKAREQSQYLEWWGFVTDSGRFKPRTRLGKLRFAWQYRLYAFSRAHGRHRSPRKPRSQPRHH